MAPLEVTYPANSSLKLVTPEEAEAAVKNGKYITIIDTAVNTFIAKTTTYDNTIGTYYNEPSFTEAITSEMKADNGYIHLTAAGDVSNRISDFIIAPFADLYKDDKGNDVYKHAQIALDRIDNTPIMKKYEELHIELDANQ